MTVSTARPALRARAVSRVVSWSHVDTASRDGVWPASDVPAAQSTTCKGKPTGYVLEFRR